MHVDTKGCIHCSQEFSACLGFHTWCRLCLSDSQLYPATLQQSKMAMKNGPQKISDFPIKTSIQKDFQANRV